MLFESLVIRDLRVYAQPIGGTIHHYRENTGPEADARLVVDTMTRGASAEPSWASLDRYP